MAVVEAFPVAWPGGGVCGRVVEFESQRERSRSFSRFLVFFFHVWPFKTNIMIVFIPTLNETYTYGFKICH
jgi:hypothetical protein